MDSTPTQTQTRPSVPPRLEDLARRTARALLLPYIISYASTHGPSDQPQEVAVIVNPRTGSMTMIDGDVDGTPIWGKEGLVPASRESIDAMPTIKVGEQGLDCAICLSEFEIGEEAKQMPCKHKYHAGCIDKWLGIQGSCPVCRFKMPVDGEDERKDGGGGDSEADESGDEEEEEDEGDDEEAEDGEEGEGVLGLTSRIPTFVFHIYFAGRNRPSRNSGSESRERNGGSGARESEEEESDGSASEDMEVESGSASAEMEMDMDIDGSFT